jgi:putative peptidoglycan lipid II flippase
MRRLLGPTIAISVLSLVGQIVTFAVQIVAASLFGSHVEMDAYLAAITLPTYANAVMFGSVSYVLVPLLVELRSRNEEQRAWTVASGVVTLYLIVATSVALLGAVFARQLIALTLPGLPETTRELAASVSWVAWPAVLLNGLVLLLTGLYHSSERFRVPALAPVLGGIANLAFIALFARTLGAHGLAFGALLGVIVQVLLLAPGCRDLRLRLQLRDPNVRRLMHLLWPLVVGALFAQAAAPIERFVASGLPPGSIPHLGYASRLNTAFAALLSGGIAVTLFPMLARLSARNDIPEMRKSLGLGMRVTWLLVAPTVALGIALAQPLIATLLQRGAFTAEDTRAVAMVLPFYLVALIGMTQGNMTARGLYALKYTRVMSVISIVEVAVYAALALPLADRFGTVGVAATMAICANTSFLLQSAMLWRRIRGWTELVLPFLKIAVAAASAALVSRAVASVLGPAPARLFVGGLVGLVAYAVVLFVLRSHETRMLVDLLRRRRTQD